MAQQLTDSKIEEARARSTLYRFLSAAFLPPEEGDALAQGPVRAAVCQAARHTGGAEVAAAAEAVCRLLRASDARARRAAHALVFGHQVAKDCPIYETQYGSAHVFQQTQQMADIAGFYLAFGLEVADGAGERVDHLSLELEFMHALAFREAFARLHHGPQEVALLEAAQRAFLRDHLGRWAPVFAGLLARRTDGLYRELARLLDAFIRAEAARFGIPAGDEVELAPQPSLDPAETAPLCGAGGCPLGLSPEDRL